VVVVRESSRSTPAEPPREWRECDAVGSI